MYCNTEIGEYDNKLFEVAVNSKRFGRYTPFQKFRKFDVLRCIYLLYIPSFNYVDRAAFYYNYREIKHEDRIISA